MAYKAPKPTKAQLAEAKVRAAASGIAMNQSAKGLRNASKAIVAGASMLPAGRAVKAAATVAKAATKAGSSARALKAAQGPSLAKGAAKKTSASSGKNDRKIVNITAKANMEKGLSRKESYAKAAKVTDARKAIAMEESKKILARAAAEKKAAAVAKNLKGTKPMQSVPKGTSDRFNATLKKLAAEEAAKKKK
jgi:hypothetical protein